jgi:hypothetical protein
MAVTPTYNTGVLPADYTATVESTLNMVEKIAKQALYMIETDDHLYPLEKGEIDNGTDIEQVVVQLAAGNVFDADRDAFSATAPSLAVRYFKTWTPYQYDAKVTDDDIRKVMMPGRSYTELADMIVGNLAQSYMQENYEIIRDMFANADVRTGCMKKIGTATNNNYKDILTQIKNAVSGMKFVNKTYNAAGIKRRTRSEDIIILMPYTIKNAMDVNELASVFNLSKDELDARIIEIDPATANAIYILDRNAAQIYTRVYGMESIRNPANRTSYYYLTVDKMYAMSPLFDCAYIELTEPQG